MLFGFIQSDDIYTNTYRTTLSGNAKVVMEVFILVPPCNTQDNTPHPLVGFLYSERRANASMENISTTNFHRRQIRVCAPLVLEKIG